MWRARRANLPNSRLCYRGRLRSKGGSGFAEIGRKLISAEVASLATAVADIALISTTWSVVVGATGIEPVTPSMSTRCSPAELRALQNLTTGRVRISAPKRAGKDACRALLSYRRPGSGGQHL